MKPNYPIKKLGKNFYALLSVLVIVLLLTHTFFSDVSTINNTTVFLLLILVFIPYLPLIRKIKFGGFEAEISNKELSAIEKKLSEVTTETKNIETEKKEYLEELAEQDPTLALAKARIEIEKKIKALAQIYLKDIDVRRFSLRKMINKLVENDVLELSLGSLLNEVVMVANRAIHGESVSKENAIRLAEFAAEAMNKLDYVFIDRALKSQSSKVITKNELESFMNGKYILKTVVPYVKNPETRIYQLNQTELDAFLDGYDEYAEFIVSLERKNND